MATPSKPRSFDPQAPSETASHPPSVPGEAVTPSPPPGVPDGEPLGLTGPAAATGTAVVVPGYEVVRELGRGGTGVVYQARQTKLNRPVALKMILAGSHAGAADLARFQMEAQAIARLRHPNIVQVVRVVPQRLVDRLPAMPRGVVDHQDDAGVVLPRVHPADVAQVGGERLLQPAGLALAGSRLRSSSPWGVTRRRPLPRNRPWGNSTSPSPTGCSCALPQARAPSRSGG